MQYQPYSSSSSGPMSSGPFAKSQSSSESIGLAPWQAKQPSMPAGLSQQPTRTPGFDHIYGLGTSASLGQHSNREISHANRQQDSGMGKMDEKTSNLLSFPNSLGSESSTSAWNTNPMRPDATGLGISSHRDASNNYTSHHMSLSPHATGSPMPFSSSGAASPSFPNPHQWGGSMGGGPALAGIKPFQPTSSFGHSLLKNQFGSPDTSETKETPTQDLLQF